MKKNTKIKFKIEIQNWIRRKLVKKLPRKYSENCSDFVCLVFVGGGAPTSTGTAGDNSGYKDWVFLNYTFKRFEGLTPRNAISTQLTSATTEANSSETWADYVGDNLQLKSPYDILNVLLKF